MNKLLIYIVSYQRKGYTQGTINAIHNVLPDNSEIIVCDNGSTDGTREWLQENQEKYNLGLLFPDKNLRVGGAWTLLTNYYKPEDFDYILLLDNDNWFLPDTTWFKTCIKLFNTNSQIGSLGLFTTRKPGYFAKEQIFDQNFNNKKIFETIEYYDTVFYAGARLDKFSLWHSTMKNWPHQFIGDKIGRHYNSVNYRTLKIHPGYIVDISTYDFLNKNHEQYNKSFYEKERDQKEYDRVSTLVYNDKNLKEFVTNTFGESFLNYIYYD